ncbi:MAG: hypothetical protein PVH19_13905 [Planctomycetia bacterium]|jgi:hypothetical protein
MPRLNDIKIDKKTGLLKPTHGVSLNTSATKVAQHGEAHKIVSLPDGLKIKQRGRDLSHFEIMPTREMSLDEYKKLLSQVIMEKM